MTAPAPCPALAPNAGLLARLLRDRAGNTLAIIAAALFPLLALVGGAVDMSRGYLAESRLQQACDAGVLAARKRLGTSAAVDGRIPANVGEFGQRFFNINFRDGAYGSKDRQFTLALSPEYAVLGEASVQLPTTLMQVFAFTDIPIRVECEAQLNFSNTDVMMVLDVTGSMAQTNPGDSDSRLGVLKSTVRSFHEQLDTAAVAGTRIRYGFVPYSTNVNVLHLLQDDWVVDKWVYQSRDSELVTELGTKTTETAPARISGTATETPHSVYDAVFVELLGWTCPNKPADSYRQTEAKGSSRSEVVLGPPPGIRTYQTIQRTRNGEGFTVSAVGSTCHVSRVFYTDYVDQFERVTEPADVLQSKWRYGPYIYDVANFRAQSNGCIEERETYVIDDYNNVDLTRALDLDIDLVPGSNRAYRDLGLANAFKFGSAIPGGGGDEDEDDGNKGKGKDKGTDLEKKLKKLKYDVSKWRPMYPDYEYLRQLRYDNTGAFDTASVLTSDNYLSPAVMRTAACPPPARKLAPMTTRELDDYLATLQPSGNTYHDIGMLWGGRLISPTGLFAAENGDVGGTPTKRNLIFLTDGETAPLDISYSSYGVEPLDQRRWAPGSPLTLTQTIEARFRFACMEVRKRNVTVWVVGFGTELTEVMKQCAGEGHYFEAADATQLNAAFAKIAKDMSELRIQR
jgi:hypothetical protein